MTTSTRFEELRLQVGLCIVFRKKPMVHCIFVVFELFSFGGKNIPSKTTCLTGLAILVLQTQQLKRIAISAFGCSVMSCNLSSSNLGRTHTNLFRSDCLAGLSASIRPLSQQYLTALEVETERHTVDHSSRAIADTSHAHCAQA